MSESPLSTNRLATATSPYLRQHAGNPVHWQPWDEAALAEARRLDRPILLSIGYSACHWCHVMAHECFENPAIAEQMNASFINIKVDREERPDLDRIYQTAHQLLVGRGGGWPLTLFLTPDQMPFFAGTYFPAEPRQGMPGFGDVMDRITRVWRDHRDEIDEQNADLQRVLDRLSRAQGGNAIPDRAPIDAARHQLGERFDPAHGGFGSAPKFPQPMALERLLRQYARSQQHGETDRGALHMACHTLRRMALGGIYDQVGGGFARYSVDNEWMIPHFEKMLSDNALLIGVATDAFQATGDRFFRRIARETAEWALREMELPDGGFATSLDADSADGEGAFYLWTPEAVRAVVDADEAELVIRRLGLDEKPNFDGRWHLQVHMAFSELAKVLHTPRQTLVERWKSAQQKLRAARDQRPHPARDDKALTAWNALMIRSLARAGRFLDLPDLIDAAERTEAFIKARLEDGYLDDYAFLLAALIELQQARWSDARTQWAQTLADTLLTRFEDGDAGGFYFTAHDHEALIQRPRTWADDALPAGNGVAALSLNRLGHWLGEPRYLAAAERTLAAAADSIDQAPAAHCSLLDALDEQLDPPQLVVIRGDEATRADLREVAEGGLQPQRLIFTPSPAQATAAAPVEGTGAWVCPGRTCLPRATSAAELRDRLNTLT
ncbi:thioredoxin domain-containing protein [Spiribacter vilamensis]|uniref:Spermatogenesis-associated protein 20-like TRX domain-containing protein n=1 Tax=Spiribacter vilamensis TaxID=531306 RepID=A0A4V6MHG7_9GAMM|nr:thioredoxin domain-containing protein [Spiribacter vilamensis]RZU99145.1 hypothetical protein EV698_1425 [Spiribacter vilamensis]TVO61861.1 thioredoxin domain-containing protein [Spiribacter vilamensis]